MNKEDINILTGQVIKSYFNVYNTLGFGFLEKVYEKSLIVDFKRFKIHGRSQVPIRVHYLEQDVGFYIADIIVDNKLIIEVKAAEGLCEAYEAQSLNYLRATEIEYGLLLNFGKKPEFKRKIWTNEYPGRSG